MAYGIPDTRTWRRPNRIAGLEMQAAGNLPTMWLRCPEATREIAWFSTKEILHADRGPLDCGAVRPHAKTP